ncbi:MAG TPA: DUF6519 domain-containing protein [Thermoanaerobaculia bacterium]|nr:DUF6519 domain-containing protein [Thermoanaerobaculia bacterium]
MRADFSRLRFLVQRHYQKVLQQQGRVWLDSDGNEEVAIRAYQDEERMRDLVGRCGVPAPYTAFRIESLNNGSLDFIINGGPGSEGDFYVDGILARNEQLTTYKTQPDYPEPPPLPEPATGQTINALAYLEVWERLITYLEDEDLREIALDGPDTTVRSQTISQVKFLVLDPPAVTCPEAATQLPSPLGNGTLTTLQPTQTPDPADICRLPQEITFTGRENRLYRVEIHERGDVIGGPPSGVRFDIALAQDVAAGALTVVLTSALTPAAATRLGQGGSITLRDNTGRRESVFVTSVGQDTKTLTLARPLRTPFTTAAATQVAGGVARFKWSRSNAAFAVGVTDVSNDRLTLTVSSLGRDDATALRQGDLVEITDDKFELGIGCGHLTRLAADPNPDELTVLLEDALPSGLGNLQMHVTLRRWDGEGFASTTFDEINTPDMNLGDGVHIQFGGFDLRIAEYWNFASRVIDGSVEDLFEAPPKGIVRHRCPLALVSWKHPFLFDPNAAAVAAPEPVDRAALLPGGAAGGGVFRPGGLDGTGIDIVPGGIDILPDFDFDLIVDTVVLTDCRPKIPLLTRMIQMHYVAGDGQECDAGETLEVQLEVGVTNGPFAMPGIFVRFQSADPAGVLTSTASVGNDISVETGGNGVAVCVWKPPAVAGVYTVLAQLLLTAADQVLCVPLHLTFNCRVNPVAEPVFTIEAVTDGNDNQLENDTDLSFNTFMTGFTARLKAPVDPASIARPTAYVSLELPELISDGGDFGFETIHLRGEVNGVGDRIVWKPDGRLNKLGQFLGNRFSKEERFLLHLTLRGNFIWSNVFDQRLLDGDSFATRKAPPIGLKFDSGDGRPGGDFRMWFWLRPAITIRNVILNVINAQLIEPVSQAIARDEVRKVLPPDFSVDLDAKFDQNPARAVFSPFRGTGIRLISTPDLDTLANVVATSLRNVGARVELEFLGREALPNAVDVRQAAFFLLLEEDHDALQPALPPDRREAFFPL